MTCEPELIGHIARLQVQTAHLKQGEKPHRWYDPAPITGVAALRLDDGGVTGIGANGEIAHDVHHRDHPISRHRGDNGVSIGFTSHYVAMRDQFGAHLLPDGIAGENILVACDDRHTGDMPGADLLVATGCGLVRLGRIVVAAPCVEFSKYCLQYPHDRKPDRSVTGALQFLHNGMRGYYAMPVIEADARTLRAGDPVYCERGDQH